MLKASAATLLLLTASAIAQTTKQWELTGQSQWQPIATTQPAPNTPAPTLDRVEKLINDRQYKAAFDNAVAWVQANKKHPQRDRALYLIARALYGYGDRIKAFYYLDELLDTYPESPYYYRALEKQFQIADRYLNGYKRRFLGMPMFHAYEEAIEMLYRIQNRSPGSPLAETALLRSADYYFADRQYDFAADTYAWYLRRYPRSPHAPRAKLRQAFSAYAQFRGPRFDATPIIDAREHLRSVLAENEQLAREENVPALLQQIDRDLARKVRITGDFYRRTGEERGAVYSYRYVTKAYPQTPEAMEAEARLRAMPESVVKETPEAAITPGFAPGSPPPDMPRVLPKTERTRQ